MLQYGDVLYRSDKKTGVVVLLWVELSVALFCF